MLTIAIFTAGALCAGADVGSELSIYIRPISDDGVDAGRLYSDFGIFPILTSAVSVDLGRERLSNYKAEARMSIELASRDALKGQLTPPPSALTWCMSTLMEPSDSMDGSWPPP